MNGFLEKLSSYNLFNNLFPGVIFVVLARLTTKYDLVQDDLLVGVFLYYFVGMIIGRLGSLIVEPFLRWCSFMPGTNYPRFIRASSKEPRLEVLSEVNNTYRTVVAMFLALLVLFLIQFLETSFTILVAYRGVAAIVLLGVTMAFAYRKQDLYVERRINEALSTEQSAQLTDRADKSPDT